MDELHYLTEEEEKAIKANIPWGFIEPDVRELVRTANKVAGIATVQSCAGHITDHGDSWHIEHTHIAFKATKERTLQILFDAIMPTGILDASLRYWTDGTFWIRIDSDPGERWRLFELFQTLGDLRGD